MRRLSVTDDPKPPRRPVLGRPPVDGTDEELDEWVISFIDQMLGPEGDRNEASSHH
jgi:hypothetical protein